MSTTLTINGVGYPYPTDGDPAGWGDDATNWATAITNGVLQTTGGTLTGDLSITGNLEIDYTALANGDHGIHLSVDSSTFSQVNAFEIDYITGVMGAGIEQNAIAINIDQLLATDGEIFGLQVTSTEGSADAYGMKVGIGVGPVHQTTGTFANPTTGTNNTTATDVPAMIDGSAGTTTSIMVADNDYIIIGAAAAFTELEIVLDTVASGAGAAPTFWYSITGTHQFTQFFPTDGTDGFTHTGIISWDADDLVSHVADGVTGTFDIKIIRTRNTLTTTPILDYAKTAATLVCLWDENGDIEVRNLRSGFNATIGRNDYETWHGDYSYIQLGGNAAFAATKTSGAGNILYNMQNVYINAAGSFEFQESDEASYSYQSSGLHIQRSIAAGTAGNTAGSFNFITVAGLSSNGAEVLSVGKSSLVAHGGNYSAVQVGGNSNLISSQATGASKEFDIAQNTYWDGSAWKYISTDQAGYLRLSDGDYLFRSAASGTAGNNVSWTDVVKLGLSSNGAEVLSVGKSSFEAWAAAWSAFQLGGNANLFAQQGEGASNQFNILQNAYFDGSYKYISTDEASYAQQSNGDHKWYSAASGTAGNAITWTETMRTGISSNGAEVLSVGKSSFEAWSTTYSALQVGGNSSIMTTAAEQANTNLIIVNNAYNDGGWKYISTDEASYTDQTGGAHKFLSTASGTAGNAITWTETMRTGLSSNGAEVLSVGNTSIEAWGAGRQTLQLGSTSAIMESYILQNALFDGSAWKYRATNSASYEIQSAGTHQWNSAPSGTAGTNISWTETMRTGLSSNGAEVLSVGKSTIENFGNGWSVLQVGGTGSIFSQNTEVAGRALHVAQNAYFDGSNYKYILTDEASDYYQVAGNHVWQTAASGTADTAISWTESMRIDTSGDVLVGKTTSNFAVAGIELKGTGGTELTRDGNTVLHINRLTNDGTLVSFYQAGSSEGSISVSGTTITYGTFCGGHNSQLSDLSVPNLEKGTVVETIDEMCEWTLEDGSAKDNDQLVKFKVSDTVKSKRVYGIFSNLHENGDANIHALGATVIRVTGACAGGDLLESNGDGTAKVQADDIIRSSTIGKVTKGDADVAVTLVTCVLYCG